MLSSENAGNIHLTKIYCEQVYFEDLDTHQCKKVMGVWKNPLRDMNKQTTEQKNKIKQWNNLHKNSYLPRKNAWKNFWVTLWASIKYVIPVKSWD